MLSNSVSDFIAFIPELFLIAVGFVILLIGIFSKYDEYNEKVFLFNKLFFIVIIALILSLILLYSVSDIYNIAENNLLFILSPSIFLSKMLLIILSLCLLLLFRFY